MALDFLPGNRLQLLENGAEFFPALLRAIDAAREAVSSMSHAIEEQAKAAQLLAQQVEQAAQAADGAAERAGDSEAKAKLLLEVARQAEEGLQHSFRA